MNQRHRVVLVRHGESHWNVQGRWQGHAGIGLTDRGRAQAVLTAAFLARCERDVVGIVRSDLDRAAETAEPLEQRLPVPVTATAAWREIDVGWWAGYTHEEIAAKDPEGYAAWQQGEAVLSRGGETPHELRARVRAALRAIRGHYPVGTVLVVTHGGPIQAAAVEASTRRSGNPVGPGGVANCSVSVVERGGSGWSLTRYNATDHLAAAG